MRLQHRYFALASSASLIYFLLRLHIKYSSVEEASIATSFLVGGAVPRLTKNDVTDSVPIAQECSMGTCFNWTNCLWTDSPKVYVYPNQAGNVQPSSLYSNILTVIRESYLFTANPDDACLFVLSIDTVDRDKISENYVKDITTQIQALPEALWANGRNHVIFNLYFGSFPDYSDHDLGFDVGEAMIAWTSSSVQDFRHGFDLSFPLFHKEHPVRFPPMRFESSKNVGDKYLGSFKGKRYVYGIGSETRSKLHHLHDNQTMIIATTCRHNTDWKKFEDTRCATDNDNYERWDYTELLDISTFCLIPRGRRLGSFRFLEAVRAGCIPVVLSDDWVLPFSEVVDWSKAVVFAHEDTVFFLYDYLLNIPNEKVGEMKQQAKLLYHKYFSSVEKIVLSTLEIVLERTQLPKGIAQKHWNRLDVPTSSLKSPGLTVVLQGILRNSSRLNRIIELVSTLGGLKKIIVIWPRARGTIPSKFPTEVFTIVVEADLVDQSELLKLDLSLVEGDQVIFIDERVSPTAKELKHLIKMATWNPATLLSFYVNHYTQVEEKSWALTKPLEWEYSFGLLHFAAVHKQFLREYQNRFLHKSFSYDWFMPQCHVVLFNVLLSDLTLRSPLWMDSGRAMEEAWMVNRNQTVCFNKIINRVYNGKCPLLTSIIRNSIDF